jgi:hypothetical protein
VDNYQSYFVNRWFALDQFSALPDELVIATTEVGHPAAMNPGKQIVDLAGLNDLELARSGFAAEPFFEQYSPDLLYMPHEDYQAMIDQIVNNTSFQNQYEHFPTQALGESALMGLALRRDSPFYPALRDIVQQQVQSVP